MLMGARNFAVYFTFLIRINGENKDKLRLAVPSSDLDIALILICFKNDLICDECN